MTKSTQRQALLEVDDLTVQTSTGHQAVEGVSFRLEPGRTLALVGESGSGKTLTAKAVAGLLPRGVNRVGGRIVLDGVEVPQPRSRLFRERFRPRIGYIFQDPMTALNPVQTVFRQVADAVDPAGSMRKPDRNRRTWQLLEQVRLPDLDQTARKIPAELSGGMCQRVVIAIAIARNPQVLIADEPTTALDVSVQAQVLSLLARLRRELSAGLLLISHDLAVVSHQADHIAVFKDGRVVEHGTTSDVLFAAQHPYTRQLIASTPTLTSPVLNPESIAAEGRRHVPVALEAKGVHKSFETHDNAKRRRRQVLHDVAFRVHEGQSIGIAGESGSGKSTLLRILAGLDRADAGAVELFGTPAQGEPDTRRARLATMKYWHQNVQVVFQDSWGSLDPHLSISASIGEPLRIRGDSRSERQRRVLSLMDEVGLSHALGRRRPHELSGGQRQRAGIARALALDPRILLADEPVSALDVSTQDRILVLLARLQREREMTLVIASHDLAVLRLVTSELYVIQGGRVVEAGPTERLISAPEAPYTRELVAAVPQF